MSVMGLITDPNAVIEGSIRYKGRELVGLSRRASCGACAAARSP